MTRATAPVMISGVYLRMVSFGAVDRSTDYLLPLGCCGNSHIIRKRCLGRTATFLVIEVGAAAEQV